MKNFTLLILACSLFTSVGFAQVDRKMKVRTRNTSESSLFLSPVYEFNGGHQNRLGKAPQADAAIVAEDFSKFTAGTESEPDMTDVCDPSTYLIDPSLTQIPGWSGTAIYQAGGVAYLGMFDEGYGLETAYINTPILDFSQNGGTSKFTFRAKSKLQTGDSFVVLLLDEYGQFASSYVELELTNEWEEYSVTLSKGTERSYIQMYAAFGECYIDDISVSADGLRAPESLYVTSYKGSSATLNWSPVEDAESYQLTVYYFDNTSYENVYLLKNEPVAGTSYDIDGLEKGISYVFGVASVKGTEVSPMSEHQLIVSSVEAPELIAVSNYTPTSFTIEWSQVEGASSYLLSLFCVKDNALNYLVKDFELQGTSYDAEGLEEGLVYYCELTAKMPDGTISKTSEAEAVLPDLDTPVAVDATEVAENGFVANWNSVPFATNYIVNLSKKHEALADQAYSLADISFTSLESNGTLENPEFYDNMYVTSRSEGTYGWVFSMAAAIDGAMGLDNTYAMFMGPSFVYSPQIDFSAGGGKVNIEVEALCDIQSATLSVAFAEVIGNQLSEVSFKETQITNVMTKQTLTLEGGKDGYVVLIYTMDNTNVYFGSIKASMDLNKGEEIVLQEDAILTENVNSYKFENIKATAGDLFYYDVTAAMNAGNGNVVYSDASNSVEVKLPTAITDLKVGSASAYISGNTLYVYNPQGCDVAVYTVAGNTVSRDLSGNENVQIRLEEQGVYVVRVGEQTFKVMR